MATTYSTTDCYNLVSDALLEPYNSGAGPGLSLGIVTQQDILNLMAVVLADFVNRTGLVWNIFTQQIQNGVATYQFPENLNEPKVCMVGGQYIDHSSLADLDDWQYSWQTGGGTPEHWYSDGLPPKTIGVALTPNYDGSGYVIPTGPTAAPPFGVSGLFNGATTGQFNYIVDTSGTAVIISASVSTGAFDVNWNNYYPLPSITIAGVSYPMQSVNSATSLTLQTSAGTQTALASVNIGNDGNLSIVGTTELSSITLTLDEVMPVIPDSFGPAIAYGVLARIFSGDSECKDLQRSYYCNTRYLEYANAASSISGEMLAVG